MRLYRGDIVELKNIDNINIDSLGKNIQNMHRPYLIVSNNINNIKSNIVNIVPLSKQIQKEYPMHVKLNKEKYGFKYDSLVCCEQILTINQDHIGRIVSHVDKEDLQRINKALTIQFISC